MDAGARPTSSRGPRALLLLTLLGLLVGLLASPARADEEPPSVQVVDAPVVTGTARFGQTLTSTSGTYDPADATVTRQWLRDGSPLAGATGRTYRLVGADVGHAVTVRVTATAPGRTAVDTVPPARTVAPAPVASRSRPTVTGTRRYGHTLKASPGRWSVDGLTVRYQWFRDRTAIRGATRRTRAVAPADVGHRLRLRVTVSKRYHRTTSVTVTTGVVRHRRDARRTITYSVQRDGSRASLATFRTQAAQTLADARGWRGSGVRFRRVASGGDFTLVLARADRVPAYSPVCSARFSCRVGRYVIINENRWNGATRVWRGAKRSVRDYRHMVVNHEVGHFLGRGHVGCGGKGRLAPIMQQQSKGLHGCKPNPWPRRDEL